MLYNKEEWAERCVGARSLNQYKAKARESPKGELGSPRPKASNMEPGQRPEACMFHRAAKVKDRVILKHLCTFWLLVIPNVYLWGKVTKRITTFSVNSSITDSVLLVREVLVSIMRKNLETEFLHLVFGYVCNVLLCISLVFLWLAIALVMSMCLSETLSSSTWGSVVLINGAALLYTQQC